MNSGIIKIIGIVATGVGMAAEVVAKYVSKKETEEKIAKEVAKQVSQMAIERKGS